MFGIIAVLIVLIFLIIFYKWCGNRKSLFYKVLLFIGAIPFIYNLIISIISAKSGFTLFDFTPVYGLKAFTTCFSVYCFFYFHIFIPAGIAVIIAIINLIKLKRGNKNEQKNKKILQFSLIIIVLLITLIISILYVQPSLFFYPWHDEKSYNQLLNEENFEEIKINNNGKLLNGWIKYNTDQQQAPLLIFFGGNAQNSSNTCLNFLHTDKYKYFEGYNLMIIDYPGYGLSDGKPSDKTMFDSALKVYDYASQLDCVDEDNIVVLGYSIGTGVATYVASQRNVNGLILVAPYDEALSLYNDTVNILHSLF